MRQRRCVGNESVDTQSSKAPINLSPSMPARPAPPARPDEPHAPARHAHGDRARRLRPVAHRARRRLPPVQGRLCAAGRARGRHRPRQHGDAPHRAAGERRGRVPAVRDGANPSARAPARPHARGGRYVHAARTSRARMQRATYDAQQTALRHATAGVRQPARTMHHRSPPMPHGGPPAWVRDAVVAATVRCGTERRVLACRSCGTSW